MRSAGSNKQHTFRTDFERDVMFSGPQFGMSVDFPNKIYENSFFIKTPSFWVETYVQQEAEEL